MRILYDGYIFSAQSSGGISRYFSELIRRLPAAWSPVITVNALRNRTQISHPNLRIKVIPLTLARLPGASRYLTRPYLKLLESRSAFDLVHPTYYFRLPKSMEGRKRRPLVVTVHDMIAERFSALTPTAEIEAKRRMIEAADAIICISENTKHELQEYYTIPDSRITVIYLAASLARGTAPRSAVPAMPPYCLFLGNRAIYKNFARTLLAFKKVGEQWPNLKLRVVGDPFRASEVELIRALEVTARVEHLGVVADSDLVELYQQSEALLYPSLHEGFGIPPLEAMACGTVVIASNQSSVPEVVGDAAILVNPESIDEIAAAILSLKNLGPARNDLVRRGLARVQRFNWDETARRTIEVYKSVC